MSLQEQQNLQASGFQEFFRWQNGVA